MARGFVITGMPRTQMAWLSVLLTTDQSVCYPEPLKDMQDPEDIERLIDAKGYTYVGIADTGMVLFPDIIDRLHLPVVLVTRDARQVAEELVQMGTDQEAAVTYCERMRRACDRLKTHPFVLGVHADQVRERRMAEKIFWHCLPGIAFDEVRYKLLYQLLITQNPLAVIAAAMNNLGGMARVFRDRFEHLSETMQ